MRQIATGRLGAVHFVRLAPGDDLYLSIIEVAREKRIRAGVILDLTGAATNLRLSVPTDSSDGSRPGKIIDIAGLTEVLGSGVIGLVENDFVSKDGEVTYRAGDPYAHIHVAATVGSHTYSGHLVEGTLVRSVMPKSHFTIAIAEVEGVDLSLHVEHNGNPDYPGGVPYHELSTSEAKR